MMLTTELANITMKNPNDNLNKRSAFVFTLLSFFKTSLFLVFSRRQAAKTSEQRSSAPQFSIKLTMMLENSSALDRVKSFKSKLPVRHMENKYPDALVIMSSS